MYCLAYSESAHGSDLAAIETRAETLGNTYVVTGVKTFVADADRASDAIVLCRTANGLAHMRVPLHDNNVEIRPIRTLAGEDTLFELDFQGAHGELAEVELERTPWIDDEPEFWDLVDTARRNGRNADPNIRQQLAWAYSQLRVIRLVAERDASLARLMWSEYHRRFGELAMEIVGTDGLVRPELEAYATSRWQHVFLTSRGDTMAMSTSELQRTSIAEKLLDLPRGNI